MDWLESDPTFKKKDRGSFRFTPLNSQSEAFEIHTIEIRSDKKHETGLLLRDPTFKNVEKYRDWIKNCRSSTKGSDARVLFLAMHKRLQDDTQDRRLALPYTESDFKEFTTGLFQHKSLAPVIGRESTAVFTSRSVTWGDAEGSGRSIVYHCKSDTESLPREDDIVLSTTCFIDCPVLFAVMYGCTDDIIKYTKTWLERSGKAVFHPLVLPMIFSELERKRLFNETDERATLMGSRILELRKRVNRTQPTDSSEKDSQTDTPTETSTETDCNAIELAQSMRSLVNGLESFQEQLILIKDDLEKLPTTNSHLIPNLGASPEALQEPEIYIERRLRDMLSESRSKARSCEALVGTMTFVTQMELNYYTRRVAQVNFNIATSTSKDSAQMKQISVLGAAFLPGSLVASIFSMSIFKWMPEDSDSIVSPYLGVYFLVTATLMLLTYFGLRKTASVGIDEVREQLYEELDNEDDRKLFPRRGPRSRADSSDTVPLNGVAVQHV